MTNQPILVTGATGHQGGAAARHLLSNGHQVRALVRNPDTATATALHDAGAELIVGDFDDMASLERAATGTVGVFLVPPVSGAAELEHRRAAHVIAAAQRAKVSHIVFTGIATFAGPSLPGSEAKQRIEESIRDSGIDYTLLRPVRFMENYLFRDASHDGIQDGVNRHVFLPDRPMKIIAVDDVGRMAALAFASPGRYRGRALELAGDDPTPTDAAGLISQAVGRPVTYERLSRTEAFARHSDIGAIHRIFDEADNNGWHASPDMLRRHHPNAKRLTDWLRDGGAARITELSQGDRSHV